MRQNAPEYRPYHFRTGYGATVSCLLLQSLSLMHCFLGEQEAVDQTTLSLQLSNDSSVCGSDVTDACRQRVSPSSSSSSSFCGLQLPVPDVTLCVTDCHRHTPPTTPLNTRQVSDECRRSTSYDYCVDE